MLIDIGPRNSRPVQRTAAPATGYTPDIDVDIDEEESIDYFSLLTGETKSAGAAVEPTGRTQPTQSLAEYTQPSRSFSIAKQEGDFVATRLKASPRLTAGDAVRDVFENPVSYVPYLNILVDIPDTFKEFNLARKVRNGSATKAESDELNVRLAERQRDQSLGYQVWHTVFKAIPLGIELFTGGGLIKGAAKRGLKKGAEQGMKAAVNMADDVVGKAAALATYKKLDNLYDMSRTTVQAAASRGIRIPKSEQIGYTLIGRWMPAVDPIASKGLLSARWWAGGASMAEHANAARNSKLFSKALDLTRGGTTELSDNAARMLADEFGDNALKMVQNVFKPGQGERLKKAAELTHELAGKRALTAGAKGLFVEGPARAMMVNQLDIANETISRMTEQYQLTPDERGRLHRVFVDDGDGFAEALLRSTISQSAEVGSELSSGLLSYAGHVLGPHLAFMGKVGFVESILKSAKKNKLLGVVKAGLLGTPEKNGVLRGLGFDGWFGEMFEESVNDVIGTVTGDPRSAGLIPSKEEALIRGLSFAINPMAMAGYAADTVNRDINTAVRNIHSDLDALERAQDDVKSPGAFQGNVNNILAAAKDIVAKEAKRKENKAERGLAGIARNLFDTITDGRRRRAVSTAFEGRTRRDLLDLGNKLVTVREEMNAKPARFGITEQDVDSIEAGKTAKMSLLENDVVAMQLGQMFPRLQGNLQTREIARRYNLDVNEQGNVVLPAADGEERVIGLLEPVPEGFAVVDRDIEGKTQTVREAGGEIDATQIAVMAMINPAGMRQEDIRTLFTEMPGLAATMRRAGTRDNVLEVQAFGGEDAFFEKDWEGLPVDTQNALTRRFSNSTSLTIAETEAKGFYKALRAMSMSLMSGVRAATNIAFAFRAPGILWGTRADFQKANILLPDNLAPVGTTYDKQELFAVSDNGMVRKQLLQEEDGTHTLEVSIGLDAPRHAVFEELLHATLAHAKLSGQQNDVDRLLEDFAIDMLDTMAAVEQEFMDSGSEISERDRGRMDIVRRMLIKSTDNDGAVTVDIGQAEEMFVKMFKTHRGGFNKTGTRRVNERGVQDVVARISQSSDNVGDYDEFLVSGEVVPEVARRMAGGMDAGYSRFDAHLNTYMAEIPGMMQAMAAIMPLGSGKSQWRPPVGGELAEQMALEEAKSSELREAIAKLGDRSQLPREVQQQIANMQQEIEEARQRYAKLVAQAMDIARKQGPINPATAGVPNPSTMDPKKRPGRPTTREEVMRLGRRIGDSTMAAPLDVVEGSHGMNDVQSAVTLIDIAGVAAEAPAEQREALAKVAFDLYAQSPWLSPAEIVAGVDPNAFSGLAGVDKAMLEQAVQAMATGLESQVLSDAQKDVLSAYHQFSLESRPPHIMGVTGKRDRYSPDGVARPFEYTSAADTTGVNVRTRDEGTNIDGIIRNVLAGNSHFKMHDSLAGLARDAARIKMRLQAAGFAIDPAERFMLLDNVGGAPLQGSVDILLVDKDGGVAHVDIKSRVTPLSKAKKDKTFQGNGIFMDRAGAPGMASKPADFLTFSIQGAGYRKMHEILHTEQLGKARPFKFLGSYVLPVQATIDDSDLDIPGVASAHIDYAIGADGTPSNLLLPLAIEGSVVDMALYDVIGFPIEAGSLRTKKEDVAPITPEDEVAGDGEQPAESAGDSVDVVDKQKRKQKEKKKKAKTPPPAEKPKPATDVDNAVGGLFGPPPSKPDAGAHSVELLGQMSVLDYLASEASEELRENIRRALANTDMLNINIKALRRNANILKRLAASRGDDDNYAGAAADLERMAVNSIIDRYITSQISALPENSPSHMADAALAKGLSELIKTLQEQVDKLSASAGNETLSKVLQAEAALDELKEVLKSAKALADQKRERAKKPTARFNDAVGGILVASREGGDVTIGTLIDTYFQGRGFPDGKITMRNVHKVYGVLQEMYSHPTIQGNPLAKAQVLSSMRRLSALLSDVVSDKRTYVDTYAAPVGEESSEGLGVEASEDASPEVFGSSKFVQNLREGGSVRSLRTGMLRAAKGILNDQLGLPLNIGLNDVNEMMLLLSPQAVVDDGNRVSVDHNAQLLTRVTRTEADFSAWLSSANNDQDLAALKSLADNITMARSEWLSQMGEILMRLAFKEQAHVGPNGKPDSVFLPRVDAEGVVVESAADRAKAAIRLSQNADAAVESFESAAHGGLEVARVAVPVRGYREALDAAIVLQSTFILPKFLIEAVAEAEQVPGGRDTRRITGRLTPQNFQAISMTLTRQMTEFLGAIDSEDLVDRVYKAFEVLGAENAGAGDSNARAQAIHLVTGLDVQMLTALDNVPEGRLMLDELLPRQLLAKREGADTVIHTGSQWFMQSIPIGDTGNFSIDPRRGVAKGERSLVDRLGITFDGSLFTGRRQGGAHDIVVRTEAEANEIRDQLALIQEHVEGPNPFVQVYPARAEQVVVSEFYEGEEFFRLENLDSPVEGFAVRTYATGALLNPKGSAMFAAYKTMTSSIAAETRKQNLVAAAGAVKSQIIKAFGSPDYRGSLVNAFGLASRHIEGGGLNISDRYRNVDGNMVSSFTGSFDLMVSHIAFVNAMREQLQVGGEFRLAALDGISIQKYIDSYRTFKDGTTEANPTREVTSTADTSRMSAQDLAIVQKVLFNDSFTVMDTNGNTHEFYWHLVGQFGDKDHLYMMPMPKHSSMAGAVKAYRGFLETGMLSHPSMTSPFETELATVLQAADAAYAEHGPAIATLAPEYATASRGTLASAVKVAATRELTAEEATALRAITKADTDLNTIYDRLMSVAEVTGVKTVSVARRPFVDVSDTGAAAGEDRLFLANEALNQALNLTTAVGGLLSYKNYDAFLKRSSPTVTPGIIPHQDRIRQALGSNRLNMLVLKDPQVLTAVEIETLRTAYPQGDMSDEEYLTMLQDAVSPLDGMVFYTGTFEEAVLKAGFGPLREREKDFGGGWRTAKLLYTDSSNIHEVRRVLVKANWVNLDLFSDEEIFGGTVLNNLYKSVTAMNSGTAPADQIHVLSFEHGAKLSSGTSAIVDASQGAWRLQEDLSAADVIGAGHTQSLDTSQLRLVQDLRKVSIPGERAIPLQFGHNMAAFGSAHQQLFMQIQQAQLDEAETAVEKFLSDDYESRMSVIDEFVNSEDPEDMELYNALANDQISPSSPLLHGRLAPVIGSYLTKKGLRLNASRVSFIEMGGSDLALERHRPVIFDETAGEWVNSEHTTPGARMLLPGAIVSGKKASGSDYRTDVTLPWSRLAALYNELGFDDGIMISADQPDTQTFRTVLQTLLAHVDVGALKTATPGEVASRFRDSGAFGDYTDLYEETEAGDLTGNISWQDVRIDGRGRVLVRGEVMSITRVPASEGAMHSYVRVASVLKGAVEGLIITNNGVQVVAGADNDGDERYAIVPFSETMGGAPLTQHQRNMNKLFRAYKNIYANPANFEKLTRNINQLMDEFKNELVPSLDSFKYKKQLEAGRDTSTKWNNPNSFAEARATNTVSQALRGMMSNAKGLVSAAALEGIFTKGSVYDFVYRRYGKSTTDTIRFGLPFSELLSTGAPASALDPDLRLGTWLSVAQNVGFDALSMGERGPAAVGLNEVTAPLFTAMLMLDPVLLDHVKAGTRYTADDARRRMKDVAEFMTSPLMEAYTESARQMSGAYGRTVSPDFPGEGYTNKHDRMINHTMEALERSGYEVKADKDSKATTRQLIKNIDDINASFSVLMTSVYPATKATRRDLASSIQTAAALKAARENTINVFHTGHWFGSQSIMSAITPDAVAAGMSRQSKTDRLKAMATGDEATTALLDHVRLLTDEAAVQLPAGSSSMVQMGYRALRTSATTHASRASMRNQTFRELLSIMLHGERGSESTLSKVDQASHVQNTPYKDAFEEAVRYLENQAVRDSLVFQPYGDQQASMEEQLSTRLVEVLASDLGLGVEDVAEMIRARRDVDVAKENATRLGADRFDSRMILQYAASRLMSLADDPAFSENKLIRSALYVDPYAVQYTDQAASVSSWPDSAEKVAQAAGNAVLRSAGVESKRSMLSRRLLGHQLSTVEPYGVWMRVVASPAMRGKELTVEEATELYSNFEDLRSVDDGLLVEALQFGSVLTSLSAGATSQSPLRLFGPSAIAVADRLVSSAIDSLDKTGVADRIIDSIVGGPRAAGDVQENHSVERIVMAVDFPSYHGSKELHKSLNNLIRMERAVGGVRDHSIRKIMSLLGGAKALAYTYSPVPKPDGTYDVFDGDLKIVGTFDNIKAARSETSKLNSKRPKTSKATLEQAKRLSMAAIMLTEDPTLRPDQPVWSGRVQRDEKGEKAFDIVDIVNSDGEVVKSILRYRLEYFKKTDASGVEIDLTLADVVDSVGKEKFEQILDTTKAAFSRGRKLVNHFMKSSTDRQDYIQMRPNYFFHDFIIETSDDMVRVVNSETGKHISERTGRAAPRTFQTLIEAASVRGLEPQSELIPDTIRSWYNTVLGTAFAQHTITEGMLATDVSGKPLWLPVFNISNNLDEYVARLRRRGMDESEIAEAVRYETGIPDSVVRTLLDNLVNSLNSYLYRLPVGSVEARVPDVHDTSADSRALFGKVMAAFPAELQQLGYRTYSNTPSRFSALTGWMVLDYPEAEKHAGQYNGPRERVARNTLTKLEGLRWDNWFVNTLTNIAKWMKFGSLTLSGFHAFALLESAVAAQGMERNPFIHPGRLWNTMRDASNLLNISRANPEFSGDWLNAGLILDTASVEDYTSNSIVAILHRAQDTAVGSLPGFRHGLKFMQAYSEAMDNFLWKKWMPMLMIYTAEDLRTKYKESYREKHGVEMSDETEREAMTKIAGFINTAYGSVDWNDMHWATPKVMQALHMALFAPSWTTSSLLMAGAGNVPILKELLGRAENSVFDREAVVSYWPAMLIYVMAVVPAVLQAGIKAAFAPDDDEMAWIPALNEWGKEGLGGFGGHIDVTPIAELFGKREHSRRVYTRFAKQALEVFEGWLQQPRATLASKTSMPIKLAFEQVMEESMGGYPMDFRDMGFLRSWVTGKEEGFLGSRTANLLGKFTPMSVKALYGGEFTTLFSPTSKGIGLGKAQLLYGRALESVVQSATYREFRQNPKARLDLHRFQRDILKAAARNGINPEEVISGATRRVLTDVYGRLYRAIDSNDMSGVNKAVAEAIRANGTYKRAMTAMDHRAKRARGGKGLTKEERKAIRKAFYNP